MSDFATWLERTKGLWTRIYDEVIAPDFEKEWKKREEKHQNELKDRDENQQLLFNHINEQIVKHAQVVEENQRLGTELTYRSESAAPSTHREDASPTSNGVSEEQHRDLANRYDDLSKKYQDLSQKVRYLERKNIAVMQKNKDMKDSVRAWQQYADRQKPLQKLKAAAARSDDEASKLLSLPQSDEMPPHILSSPRSVSSMPSPYERTRPGCKSPAPDTLHTNGEAGHELLSGGNSPPSSSGASTPKGPTVAGSNERQGAAYSDVAPTAKLDRTRKCPIETDGAPSSSQTTVDEAPNQDNRHTQVVHTDNEDDLPQVVSERSLKRKRGQQSDIEVLMGRSSDGTPAKPHRVKDEPLSSPPSNVHMLMRTETIDLDDPVANDLEAAGILQRTPSMHSNATGIIRHQRSGSAPISQLPGHGSMQQENRPGDRLSDVQKKLRVAAAETRAISEPSNSCHDEQVFQQLDPNTVAQAPELTPIRSMKQAATRHVEREVLAESGEGHPSVDENESRLPPSAARAHIQKLRSLRDLQTPPNRPRYRPVSGSPLVKQEQMPSPPNSTDRSAQSLPDSTVPRKPTQNIQLNKQADIVPDGRPSWSMRALGKRSAKHDFGASPSANQVNLRRRPIKELRVQDFKPNPAYNQGYSYAFSETVRKRGDRMCLPGCTNTQCCGSHFRRLAEALDPLSTTQEEVLLEDYLGDAYSTIISTQMSSDERAELVLQARTKKMAKDTGKHREAYERRRTPPGFWRVDFPTTQEQEDDRGRAKEQEVKIVQERWLEAQKRGGKWSFRDE